MRINFFLKEKHALMLDTAKPFVFENDYINSEPELTLPVKIT
jgi:hypothetical protein